MPICITPVSFYHAKAYAAAFPLSRLLYFFTSVVLLRVIPLFVCRDSCCSVEADAAACMRYCCCSAGADTAAFMRAAVASLGLMPLLARSCCCCPVDWSCNTQHNVERTQNIKIRFALFSLKDGAISDVPEIRF